MPSAKQPVEISDVAQKCPDNLWITASNNVKKYKPVNLGQGMADFPEAVPDILKAALIATQSPGAGVSTNQYCRSQGHPLLVKEIADLYSKIMAREIDGMKEVLISVGAEESLYCIINGMVNPGDEVILIEPFYDGFFEIVRLLGAVPRFIPLRMKPGGTTSADFYFDEDELTQVFNEKTKAIIVNTPHNPTGKVFSRKEIEFIADLCKKHNCLYVSDEVYEWIVYDGNEHFRPATLPGMWERTVTVGSAGKTFNVTGWKCGWSVGPEYLISAASKIHQTTVYTFATPIQIALSEMFKHEKQLMGTKESYWYWLAETLRVKRIKIHKMLTDVGLRPIMPQGGYFMMANIAEFGVDPAVESNVKELDQRFVEWMVTKKGVAAIPVSSFFSAGHRAQFDQYIRFCFIKDDKTLDEADIKLKLLKVQ